MRPQRGYQAAAITKATDPGRREDALDIAKRIHNDPAGGIRRDQLDTWYCLNPAGPLWPTGRYRSALFYAYGLRWIDFIGFTYAVDPGPAPRFGPPSPGSQHSGHAARPPLTAGSHPTTGMLDMTSNSAASVTGPSTRTTHQASHTNKTTT